MARRIILVTGSRNWTDRNAVWGALNIYANQPGTIVVHGDCPTGADHLAKQWCSTQPDIIEDPYPARWNVYGKDAGPLRNAQMVALRPDLTLAFPLPSSRGTFDCIRKVRAACLPLQEYRGA